MAWFAFKGHITDGQLKAVLIGPFGTRAEAAENGQVIGGGAADVTMVSPPVPGGAQLPAEGPAVL